jgi:hypothetical protein
MRILRIIKRWLNKLFYSDSALPTGIDSHKWETKIEILGNLSRTY